MCYYTVLDWLLSTRLISTRLLSTRLLRPTRLCSRQLRIRVLSPTLFRALLQPHQRVLPPNSWPHWCKHYSTEPVNVSADARSPLNKYWTPTADRLDLRQPRLLSTLLDESSQHVLLPRQLTHLLRTQRATQIIAKWVHHETKWQITTT